MYFVLIPIFSNTVMTCFLLNKIEQIVFCAFSFLFCMVFILLSMGLEIMLYQGVILNTLSTIAIIFTYCTYFVKLSLRMEEERTKFLIF